MTEHIIAITQNLIAAIIVIVSGSLFKRHKESIKRVIGVAKPATKRLMPSIVRALAAIVLLSFFISNLRDLVTREGAIERWEILFISFWVWWLMWIFQFFFLSEEKKPNKAEMATPRKPSDQFALLRGAPFL